MHYSFSSRTDCGRQRENNEDALLVDDTLGLAVLADGMGGYNAGEVAAGMAVAGVGTRLGSWLAQAGRTATAALIRQARQASVAEANRAILQAAHAQPAYRGMGTTLVAGVFRDERLVLGHIGDSRCYRWRRGELRQITRDHSLLQEQLDAGLITAAQAAVSSQRNLVTRALGIEPVVALEVQEFEVEPGDRYLLCSDGLTDMVDDDSIAAVLAREAGLPAQAVDLVALANARGGRDNITVLLAQAAGETAAQRSLLSRWLGSASGQH